MVQAFSMDTFTIYIAGPWSSPLIYIYVYTVYTATILTLFKLPNLVTIFKRGKLI